eukprot:CAMPEP_0178964428 /NCGR_PEP_ID=MMETSP0789-20121207/15665_1 /TAXON_ID=3005 /ORGANISM="Rhizosolenia setigera, Strain CCMP 1694" /LENGTH=76 /DNA_ID=CAMNT_0020649189 /DNA_START=706 /DNA_END=936 /DNA_ORIENTATION=+
MKVNDEPKKWTDANGAMNVITLIPKNKNMTKSAVLPRNSPSSSKRQYLTKKYIWNRKSIENVPKNRYVVINRHTCP